MCMNHRDKVRCALESIADGRGTDLDKQLVEEFTAWEIYSLLVPSRTTPGDLFRWFTERRRLYTVAQWTAWLYGGGVANRIPVVVKSYAIRIVIALVEGTCNCWSSAYSKKFEMECLKRCPKWHHLTRQNLDRYATESPMRMRAQFTKHTKYRQKNGSPIESTDDELAKAITFHSDPLTYLQRAIHGRGSVLQGNGADLGKSMLCSVLETPGGLHLRLGLRTDGKPGVSLYEVREGVRGNWSASKVECRICRSNKTNCKHALKITDEPFREKPQTTEMEFARCLSCGTRWHWNSGQTRCPNCNNHRRRQVLFVLDDDILRTDLADDIYYQRQRDETVCEYDIDDDDETDDDDDELDEDYS